MKPSQGMKGLRMDKHLGRVSVCGLSLLVLFGLCGCPTIGINVPDVAGLTEAEAEQVIEEAGLWVADVVYVYYDDVAEGLVIAQDRVGPILYGGYDGPIVHTLMLFLTLLTGHPDTPPVTLVVSRGPKPTELTEEKVQGGVAVLDGHAVRAPSPLSARIVMWSAKRHLARGSP